MGTTIVFLTFLVANCLLPCMCEHNLKNNKVKREQFQELDESKGLIILDIFGTIALTSETNTRVTLPGYDFSFITVSGNDGAGLVKVHVKFRPGLELFLKTLQEKFNLAVFSDGLQKYTDEVVKWLTDKWEIKFNKTVLNISDLDLHSDGAYGKDVSGRGMDLKKIILVDHNLLMIYHRDNAINIKPYVIENINATDNVLYELLPELSTKEFALKLASGGPLILKDSSSWLPNTPWQEAKNWIEGLAVTIRIEDSNLREVVKTKITQSNSKLKFALIPHQVKVRNSILRATSGKYQKLTLSDIIFRVEYGGNTKNPDPELMQAIIATVQGKTPTVIKCDSVAPNVETAIDDLQDYETVRNSWKDMESSNKLPSLWKLGKDIWYGVETTIEIKSPWFRDPIIELIDLPSETKNTTTFSIVVHAIRTRCQTFYKTDNPADYFRVRVTDLSLKIGYQKDRNIFPGESAITKYIEVVILPNNKLLKRSELTLNPKLDKFVGEESDLSDVGIDLANKRWPFLLSSWSSGPIN